MARIRTIKPEFWNHEELSALPECTHMLAASLLNHADDEGYFLANPGLIKAACFALRETSVSIQGMLTQLSNIGYIALGKGSDGKRYGRVVKFDEHQRVNRPTPSKIKTLNLVYEDSLNNHGEFNEGSPPERKGKEQGKEIEDARRATRLPADWKPTDELTAWAKAERPDLNIAIEAAKFLDHWVAKPGKDGRKTDWPATWRNWIRNARSFGKSNNPEQGSSAAASRRLA